MTVGEAVRTALGLLLLAGVVVVAIIASNFNGGQMRACEDRGMSWVKEYPFGDYGCAVVLPVPEPPG
jgi:hypothetical protein